MFHVSRLPTNSYVTVCQCSVLASVGKDLEFGVFVCWFMDIHKVQSAMLHLCARKINYDCSSTSAHFDRSIRPVDSLRHSLPKLKTPLEDELVTDRGFGVCALLLMTDKGEAGD